MARGYDNEDRGVLFVKKKTSAKGPDFDGHIELSRELISYLVGCAKNGREAKLELAAWKQKSGRGVPFLALRAQKPYQDRRRDTDDDWQGRGRSDDRGRGRDRDDDRGRGRDRDDDRGRRGRSDEFDFGDDDNGDDFSVDGDDKLIDDDIPF